MRERPLRVCIAGEDAAHSLLLTRLSDAVLLEGLHTSADLAPLRHFVGEPGISPVLFSTRDATARLKALLAPSGRPFYRTSRIRGQPEGDAREILDAITLAGVKLRPLDTILLLVDEDGRVERKDGLERARVWLEDHPDLPVLMGLCAPTAEAWIVAVLLQSSRNGLSAPPGLPFDPGRNPNRLTTQPASANHHAKRVLHAVLDSCMRPLSTYPHTTPPHSETEPALQHVDIVALVDLDGVGPFLGELRRRYWPMVDPVSK